MNKIRDEAISLNEAKDEQAKLNSRMGENKKVQKESRVGRTNIENLCNARKAAIDFFL